MAPPRAVAIVPSKEVLELTVELQSLGSTDVAVGRGWAAAIEQQGETGKPQPGERLASTASGRQLTAVLDAWLAQGFNAVLLLLDVPASSLLEALVAARLGAGGARLSLSWQLVAAQQPDRPPSVTGAVAATRRPGSRLATSSGDHEQPAPITVELATPQEAAQLLAWAKQAHAARSAETHLLLTLHLLSGSGAAACLNIAELHDGPEQQREHALRLLAEVASLHEQRRAGDHLLAAARLSAMNQLLAPLLGSQHRVFLAVDSGTSRLSGLMEATRSITTVCNAGAGVMEAQAQDQWLPFQKYAQQHEEQQQATQRRRPEAATREAAEAARRQRLKMARLPAIKTPVTELDLCLPAQQTAKPQPLNQQQQQDAQRPYEASQYTSAVEPAGDNGGRVEAQPSKAVPPPSRAPPLLAELEHHLEQHQSAEGGLSSLRRQFKQLYAQALGEAAGAVSSSHPAGASRSPSPAAACLAAGSAAASQEVPEAPGTAAAGSIDVDLALHAARAHVQQTLQGRGHQQVQWAWAAVGSVGEEGQQQAWGDTAEEDGSASYSRQHLGSDLEQELAALQVQGAALAQQPAGSKQQRQHSPASSSCRSMGPVPASMLLPASSAAMHAEPSQAVSDCFDSRCIAELAALETGGRLGQEVDSVASAVRPRNRPAASSGSYSGAQTPASARLTSAGSYAQRQQPHRPEHSQHEAAAHVHDCSHAGASPSSSQSPHPSLDRHSVLLAGSDSLGAAGSQLPGPSQQPPGVAPAPAAAPMEPAEMGQLAVLLAEVQREQQEKGELLQQLHSLQDQVAELSAMTTAVEAPAPGVEEPQSFDGLLAALQRERQQGAALACRLEAAQRTQEESVGQLEVRLCTLQRQLAVAQARCAAWERRSPLAPLFQRAEAEVKRVEAEAEALRQENATLARLLAEAELRALSQAAGPLPPDAAAVCRGLHDKLRAAQRQAAKLQGERDGLRRQLAASQRRDRLAELARRQAQDHMRRAEAVAALLEQREQALEAQSLVAAEAAARAQQLESRLEAAERELGAYAAEAADLQDANLALRAQVQLLHDMAGRDAVLRRIQPHGATAKAHGL